MTKSDSVSVYRRFSAPIRGKIVEHYVYDGHDVFNVKVTSRDNAAYPFGVTVPCSYGDIYDTHRPTKTGYSFTGKKWRERF